MAGAAEELACTRCGQVGTLGFGLCIKCWDRLAKSLPATRYAIHLATHLNTPFLNRRRLQKRLRYHYLRRDLAWYSLHLANSRDWYSRNLKKARRLSKLRVRRFRKASASKG